MTTTYSCYVDAHPAFEWQALLLCASLIHNAGVAPEDIIFHGSPDISESFLAALRSFGAQFEPTVQFDETHAYCNKIKQASSKRFSGYDTVVLCDCDLYFLGPLPQRPEGISAMGRQVDLGNPPLHILREIYESAGLKEPEVVPTGYSTKASEETFASNWNGGLYVLSTRTLPRFAEAWERFARYLLQDHSDRLGQYRNHIDQIAFAMALDETGLPWQTLTPGHNHPTHLPAPTYAETAPASLHYHREQDALGQLTYAYSAPHATACATANAQIRELIGNRFLTDPSFEAVFSNWQQHKGTASSQELDHARGLFREARYMRHSARRLEHLASLQLDLHGKTVLEFGAGIGEHSQFFFDRGCSVLSVEPRASNCAEMRRKHTDPAEYLPAAGHRILQAAATDATKIFSQARFQIIYNYGLLYHMTDPLGFLKQSCALASELYLLETAVSDLVTSQTQYSEDTTNATNAIEDQCLLVSRAEIFETMKSELPYVYVPRTQPAHEQFLRDWTTPREMTTGRHRAIFIGSTQPLDEAIFSPELLDYHD